MKKFFPNDTKVSWPSAGDVITTESGMNYTIGTLLSNGGGFGLLYNGYDTFGNTVAIKILKPANRTFASVRAQWKRETEILGRVRHPNVVFIHDSFICDNLCYIVFECASGNLGDLIKRVGPLSESIVREIARQLLFALHYIHKERILHKDLTIYNILYFEQNSSDVFKVSDFGISEEFWGGLIEKSKNPIAHKLFKPPELVRFGYTSIQSDLYHLGLILYFCLIGDFPYDIKAPQFKIESDILKGIPRQQAEALGTSFGNFISILLRRRDKYRFKNSLEAWEYLRRS